MNFARLNHILIPTTRDGRERLRRSLFGKALAPIGWFYGALSDEGRVLTVVMLFIGTAGLSVDTTQVYLLWCALVGLLVGSLAVRRAFSLRGVELEVRGPARVAAGEPVTFELLLHNRSDRDVHALRLGGPFLPWDGKWLGAPKAVASCAARRTARTEARAVFVARGEHQLDVFSAGALVPGGLAVGPRVDSRPFRFIVVPPIAAVARVELPLGWRYQPGGVAQASRIGEARELVGVRPYRAGDPLRDLHTKTWARSGQPHVREYQQEFFTRVGILVDNDRSSGSEDGFEAAISLAAGVVARLARGEALIDLLVIGERIHALTIGRSLGFFEQALDHLACATRDAPVDPDALAHKLDPLVARLSALVMITQTFDPARARLAAAFERRGIPVRVVRVRDDGLFARGGPAEAEHGERVVGASAIRAGEALSL